MWVLISVKWEVQWTSLIMLKFGHYSHLWDFCLRKMAGNLAVDVGTNLYFSAQHLCLVYFILSQVAIILFYNS